METSKKRIRRVFNPLTLTCSIEPLATGAQVAQTFFAARNEFVPNREGLLGLATVLTPTVNTFCKDSDWRGGLSNKSLGKVQWRVNGLPIEDVWGEGFYSVDMSATDRRGTLTIKKNLVADTQAVLVFEAQLTDPRTNVTYSVVSNEIVLSCTTASESEKSITVSRDLIEYNPFLDYLLERDWCLANSVTPKMTQQEAMSEGSPYLQQVTYACYYGNDKVQSKNVKLQQLVDDKYVDATENIALIHDRDTQTIIFDCRLLHDNTRFRLVYTPDAVTVRYAHFSIVRNYCAFDVDYVNTGGVADNENIRLMDAIVTTKDTTSRKLPFPEAQMVMQWMTDSSTKRGVLHNQGEHGRIDLSKAEMGSTKADGFIDVYMNITYRHWAVLTTETGQIIVDDTYKYIIT